MNQMDLNDAIEGAERRLRPDVDRIVDAAMTNGSRQVRRRRRGTALATVAAVAAVGVGGGWWLQRPAPVEQLTVSDATPFATGANDPIDGRRLAGAEEIRDRLLTMLPEGDVSDVIVREDSDDLQWDGSQQGVEVNLRLDGTPMRLQFIDFDRDLDQVRAHWSQDPGPKPGDCQVTAGRARADINIVGTLDGTSAEMDCVLWNDANRLHECAAAPSCAELDKFVAYSPEKEVCNYSANYPCRELPDGAWLAAGTGGDDEDSDSPFTMANRATADGWYVYASSDNEPTTVLTVDDVTAIVTSDVWFE